MCFFVFFLLKALIFERQATGFVFPIHKTATFFSHLYRLSLIKSDCIGPDIWLPQRDKKPLFFAGQALAACRHIAAPQPKLMLRQAILCDLTQALKILA